MPSAGTGLSPLEKKKRVAQASLSKPPNLQDNDNDRPTVIHCPLPQTPVPPPPSGPKSTSSVDSPGPVSTSSSRSSSPHSSLSSEDLPAAAGVKPEPNREMLPNYVTLLSGRGHYIAENKSSTCSAISKGQDISFPGTQNLKTDSIQAQYKDSVPHWGSGRDSAHTYPKSTSSSLFPNANWPPAPTSSFSKVIPKPAQPLKPTPFPRGYKISPAGLTQQHDHSRKFHHLPYWICQTPERRDKSKLFPSLQHRSLHAGSQPPPSYLTGYGRPVRDSLPQPLPRHVYLPGVFSIIL